MTVFAILASYAVSLAYLAGLAFFFPRALHRIPLWPKIARHHLGCMRASPHLYGRDATCWCRYEQRAIWGARWHQGARYVAAFLWAAVWPAWLCTVALLTPLWAPGVIRRRIERERLEQLRVKLEQKEAHQRRVAALEAELLPPNEVPG